MMADHLYINLTRSRDCMCVRRCGDVFLLRASLTYFGNLLRCPHKHIVTITKVYIAKHNINYVSGINTIP